MMLDYAEGYRNGRLHRCLELPASICALLSPIAQYALGYRHGIYGRAYSDPTMPMLDPRDVAAVVEPEDY